MWGPLAQSTVGRELTCIGGGLEGGGPAEAPRGGDEPAGVRGGIGVPADCGSGEAVGQESDGFGGFGGVLGHVGGDVQVVDACPVRQLGAREQVADGADVDLPTPMDGPAGPAR